MRRNRRLFAAFGLCAALLLTGCQNTMTRIELPSTAELSWSVFLTTLTHPNANLEVVAQGTGLNAELELQICDGGECQYFLGFGVENTFTGGALVFSDPGDDAFERTIEIVRGAGREIFVHYNLVPPPTEQNPEFPVTFLAMAPADPRFRTNLTAFVNSEPAPDAVLCANGEAVLGVIGEPGGGIGDLPIEIPGIEGDFDFMVFDASAGSGIASCNGDPPPAAIPTLSHGMLGLLAAGVLLLAGWTTRRRELV